MDTSGLLPPVDELEGVEGNEENVTLGTAPATAAQVGVVLEEGAGEGDELDDEADVEGSLESPVQIAPTGDTNPIGEEDNPMLFIQLGDRVVYDSTKYGRTIGQVYYRSNELISVKPDGVSNALHNFELEDNDEEELYKEEEGVTAAYVIEKRKFESFVEQQDFRINQIIDTFDSSGDLYKAYRIVKVDKDNDYIQIQDLDDEEIVTDVNFEFIGIPLDEDFKIISIRQLVGPESGPSNEAQSGPLEEVEEGDNEEEEEDEIEVVGFIEIVKPKVFREAAAFEQRIPDNLQKVDALNDFISSLDPTLQKDPKSIRAVRVLVETLFNLKQETVTYNDDGTIRGPKEVSANTLSELIQKVPIPLGRPVLNISKKEYSVDEEDELEERKEGDGVYFENFARELDSMVENKSSLVSSAMAGAPGGQIVREWADQQSFLKKYLSPWTAESQNEPLWKALSDSEFFRTAVPEFVDYQGETVFLETIPGYLASHSTKEPPVFDEIPFGIERALSTTYRKGTDRKKQVLVPEEGATMNSYLIFPSKTATTLGATRSSSLAIDSGRSQMPTQTMRSILEEVGEPQEVGTSNDLLLLDTTGDTLGNIPLADYIEGLSVPALGIGDTFETLGQYGLDNIELTPKIVDVLLEKIELYQNQLLSTITKLREIVDKESQKTPENNPFIETNIFEEITSQPTLVEDLQEYQRINPSLAESDIGKTAYLMKKHQDYFQVTVGKNSTLIAKALLDSNNAMFIQSLKISNLLKYNTLNAGEKPKKNTCKHVADLVAIRRIFDDSEKFQKMTEFFKKYQGTRDGNWIDCNVCKEHLLCLHERLQIQAYLNPAEKASIEKEIILKFSGGSFQGKYICRNCGQAIRDLDFDNNIEFDDNGKPKSGRAVLVDEDEDFEEKLNLLSSINLEPSQKKDLRIVTKEEEQIFDIIKEISMRLSINLDNDGYRRLIDRVSSWVSRFDDRASYNEKKKKRPKLPDYEVAVARNIITSTGLFILIEVQTRVPSYSVRQALQGCKSPGFNGYPLEEDPESKQGLEYVACAIASIRRNQAPWNQTGFQKDADIQKIQAGIMVYMESVLKAVIGDDIIQSKLAVKREYLQKISERGIESGAHDEIPPTFLPEQIIVKPEEAAKDAITPEVVANMGNKGKLALVKLWIREAHQLAKKTASLVRGSPLSETTCCLANIEAPGNFWRSVSNLPQLGRRTLVPNQQGQMLVTEFIPRSAGGDPVKPDSELYYRIFLKNCFQGPRVGYPHQPGLTNMCPWCGFQFPTIPAVMDADTEGKTALSSQNIDVSTEQFTKLLDTIHRVNNVKPVTVEEQDSVRAIMNKFGDVAPPPLPGWGEIIQQTTDSFLQLPPDADRGDVAMAAGPISEATANSERIINERVTHQGYRNLLEEIVKLSWANFFQVIQTYFITPYERLLTQFSDGSLFIPIELKKALSDQHVSKDIMPIIQNDLSIVASKEADLHKEAYSLARGKIAYFVEQMSQLLNFKNKVRPIVVPGRDLTLVYIQRAMLYGPLATLINPAEIPEGTVVRTAIKSIADPSMRYITDLIELTLNKYRVERLSFDDQQIKELIAIRTEKERANVIAEIDRMTDEERAIDLMNRRLGLGKYAVGGTKLIYAYDKEYYDLERQKRDAAGIIDFPGLGPDQMASLEGRQVDEYGFPMFGDAEFEREGGYDHNQHGDDDYE
jgi:hypothetical protein